MLQQQIFYAGIVEDIDDPLKLGRCRVRVIGEHNALKSEIPVEGLPWATPLNSTNSASMSGIGSSPVGLKPGSMVIVIFVDPESKQEPIILGSIAGIPTKSNIYDEDFKNTILRPSEDSNPDPNNPFLGEGLPQTEPIIGEIGSLSSDQITKLLSTIRKVESSNNYSAVNTLGYSGAYQMGCAILEDLGYVTNGSWAKYKKNIVLNDNNKFNVNVWSGKNGINNQKLFLQNTIAQDNACREELKLFYNRMVKGGLCSKFTPPAELAGLLMVAHLKGTGKGGVRDFLRGQSVPDAYGTSPSKYYKLGFNTISDKNVSIPSEDNITDNIRNDDITPIGAGLTKDGSKIALSPETVKKGNPSMYGFIDPTLKFPLDNHINEPDTNRLARNESLEKTIVTEKELNRATKISIANTDFIWEQPNIPYNAIYPYNYVMQTESGHIEEWDDTPESERIHLYHKSGTFIEIDRNGTKVERTVGSRVSIIEDDEKIYIMGSGILTIDGDFAIDIKNSNHVSIQGDCNLKVTGNVNQVVTGDINSTCKNYNLNCSEDININANNIVVNTEKDIDLKSKESFNITAKKDLNIKSKDTLNIKSESDFNINAQAESFISVNARLEISSLNNDVIDPLYHNLDIDDAKDFTEFSIDLNWNPELTEYDIPTYADRNNYDTEAAIFSEYSNELNASVEPSREISISEFNIIEYPITHSSRLSANFKLNDLLDDKIKGLPELGQHGLTQEQLFINLQNVANFILEPLLLLYPDLKINSGFRMKNSGVSKSVGISQHELGMAVDIGFGKFPPGMKNRSQLFLERANNIKSQLVDYDQLILESKSDGKNWIHISYNHNKNRKMLMTLIDNGKNYGGKTFNDLRLS